MISRNAGTSSNPAARTSRANAATSKSPRLSGQLGDGVEKAVVALIAPLRIGSVSDAHPAEWPPRSFGSDGGRDIEGPLPPLERRAVPGRVRVQQAIEAVIGEAAESAFDLDA